MNPTDSPFLTTEQAARELQINPRWLRTLIRQAKSSGALQVAKSFDPQQQPDLLHVTKTGTYLIPRSLLPTFASRKTSHGPRKGMRYNRYRTTRSERQQQIQALLAQTPDLSPYSIALQLSVAVTTVYRDLHDLRDAGLLDNTAKEN